MSIEKKTAKLLEISAEIVKLNELSALAGYDMTAVAPRGASKRRAELRAYIGRKRRELLLVPETKELVAELKEAASLEGDYEGYGLPLDIRAELRAYDRMYMGTEGVPSELPEELGKVTSMTEQLWIANRYNGPYEDVLAGIGRQVELYKEISEAARTFRGEEKPLHPLDPVIDSTDEGMTVEKVTQLFDRVRSTTLEILKEISERGVQQPEAPEKALSPADQKKLCEALAEKLGYRSEYGIIGTGMHPCTYGINPTDVRFTDHFYPENMFRALNSATHEGGHGIYMQNADPAMADRISGYPISGSIHESSSRFYEIMIAHSRPYYEFLLPFLESVIPGVSEGLTPEQCYRGFNRVQPGPVRLKADELTYNLHIMLRFELERRLFDGSLCASDIPGAWNEMSKEWLGVAPENAAEGWAQDMHWPAGLFGYFQSYTLGNINAAAVNEAMRRELPGMDDMIRGGDFDPIRQWLTEKWYSKGSLYTGRELMERVTGGVQSADALSRHLKERFLT